MFRNVDFVASMEADVGSAIAMIIGRALTGRPVLYAEPLTFDVERNLLVMGHAGMLDAACAESNESVDRIAPLSKMSERSAYVKDSSVYGSAAFYPSSWYSYDLGAGRNENDQQVTFVKVVCYPVRYSPVNNLVI